MVRATRRWGWLVVVVVAACSHKKAARPLQTTVDAGPVVAQTRPDAGAPAPALPADWTLAVTETEFGVGLVEKGTITVHAGGEVSLQPPGGAPATQLEAPADALATLQQLLSLPEVGALASARRIGEGTVYFLDLSGRKLEFSKPAPELVQRVLAAVHAIARSAPGAPAPLFTVIAGQTDFGAALVKHDVVTVRSTGAVEVVTPAGQTTLLQVPQSELPTLAALLVGPDILATVSADLQGEGIQRTLAIVTDLGKLERSFVGGEVPEVAGRIFAEIARLRGLAKPARTR